MNQTNKDKVFIIIPGLNEEKNIGKVVSTLKNQGYKNSIFVDDGSKDKSQEVAKKNGAIVLKHIINLGKGAAAKTGCEYAINNGAKIIVLMDADGQHRAQDVPKIVNELNTQNVDIVFGCRKIDENMPVVMKFGNWFISTFTKIVQGIDISDTQSGFKCFTSKAYKKIKWSATDYSLESEIIANVSKHKLKYSKIEIKTIYLDTFKGTTVFDGIKIVINILKYRFLGGK